MFCDALSEDLADGRSLDVSFATFVEVIVIQRPYEEKRVKLSLGLPGQTRLNFTSWVAKYSSGDQPGSRQPRRRRVRFKRVPFRGSLAWTLS